MVDLSIIMFCDSLPEGTPPHPILFEQDVDKLHLPNGFRYIESFLYIITYIYIYIHIYIIIYIYIYILYFIQNYITIIFLEFMSEPRWRPRSVFPMASHAELLQLGVPVVRRPGGKLVVVSNWKWFVVNSEWL